MLGTRRERSLTAGTVRYAIYWFVWFGRLALPPVPKD